MFWFRILLSVLITLPCQADWRGTFIDPLDGMFDASKFISENAYGFLPVPIIITDPALDGGLGLTGLFFHETEQQQEARLQALQSDDPSALAYLIPPSVTAVAVAGTGNDSWFGGIGHLAFWQQGRVRYGGGFGYGDANVDFFGNGDIRLRQPILLNTTAYGLLQSIKFKLGNSKWFAGLAQRYVNAKLSPGNLSVIDDTPISDDLKQKLKDALTLDTKTSGLGVVLEYDSRDNVFSPHQGYAYRFDYLRFDDAIASDVEFNLLRIVGTNFWQLGQKWRISLKLHSEHAMNVEGILPPYATPQLELRGIPLGRYQGHQAQDMEAQLDYILNPRWEFQLFAGAGRVALDYSDLSDADNRYTRGIGFRYQMARRYGFYMGLDFARGPDENVFYIQAGSAW